MWFAEQKQQQQQQQQQSVSDYTQKTETSDRISYTSTTDNFSIIFSFYTVKILKKNYVTMNIQAQRIVKKNAELGIIYK